MNKFKGILFCTDLDGTLYGSDRTVSKENLSAIEYFRSEGGIFTFITGRPPKTSAEICKIIKPTSPYGCFNGAAIYDPAVGKCTWHMQLCEDFLELVREVDEKLPEVGIQLNTESEIYINKGNAVMDRFLEVVAIPKVSCHYTEVEETTVKVVFGTADEVLMNALAHLLTNHPKAHLFDFIRSERTLYEILPKGANKGTALCKMAELLGIKQERTIAVGDYNNDISMIKAAGAGFAVANAVDEVKAVADYITVSNNESAIAAIVDKLDKGELFS